METTFIYDALGNLVEVTEPKPSGAGATYVTNYTYNDYGKLLTVSMPRDGTTQTRTPYAESTRAIANNDFNISIAAVLTVGQMETLAENIINELSSQFNGGLPFRSFSYELSSDIGASEVAGGETARVIMISGSAGLN